MRNFGNYQDSTDLGWGRIDQTVAVQRGTLLGKVLGLLAFAWLFTCAGVLVGSTLGQGSFLPALIGVFGTLFALMALRERAPWNLVLLYAFAAFEGIFIGPLLDALVVQGLGSVILDAAAATAGITLLAGMYGYTTHRDLSGIGRMLFIALLGVILASIIGFFLQLPQLYVLISMVMVALFSGYIMYDLNRMAKTRYATEGQAIMFAVAIYLDMFNIFIALLEILSIFGGGGGGGRRR